MKRVWLACGVALLIIAFGLLPLARRQSIFSGGQSLLRRNVPNPSFTIPRAVAPTPAPSLSFEQLTPIESGAGIIVCEPVATKTDAAFGAGCARWLHFTVGGHGELGQTPLWGAPDDARREMKKRDLQFSVADAKTLARKTGATHLALGALKTRGTQSTLSYRLWKMPDGKSVGAPLEIRGTRAQIVAGLPNLARQLARRLKVLSPRVPALRASPDELAFAGALPWKPLQVFPSAQIKKLQSLAPRFPLANIYLLRGTNFSTPQYAALMAAMWKQSSQNALVVGDMGWNAPRLMAPFVASLETKWQPWRNNYLLAASQTCRYRHAGDWAGERRWAEQAVRAAPRNPLAWLELGWSYANEASAVRNARYMSHMSASERSFIAGLYPMERAATERATELDPQNAYAWQRLAKAATFEGDEQTADRALWTSLRLDPYSRATYSWAMNMYQPKWSDDSQKLLRAAKMAAAHSGGFLAPAEDIVGALHACGLESEKAAILEECVRRNPKNPEALYNLGASLHYDRRQYRRAEQLYLQALALSPNYARPYCSLGNLHFWTKNDAKGAEALYRKAIALNPNESWFYENLAILLNKRQRRDEALAAAQTALAKGNADMSQPIYAELGLK